MHTFTITHSIHKQPLTINNDLWNYTDFQIKFMLDVQQREGFEFFVVHPHVVRGDGVQRDIGRTTVMWYESGKLRAILLDVQQPMTPEIVAGE